MKTYIGISRDHTGSMRGSLASSAMRDYNSLIGDLKGAAVGENQDTIVSVVKCGHGRTVEPYIEVANSYVGTLTPLTNYDADAPGTALWDSVDTLIDLLSNTPDANDLQTSFLVMIITDGEENASKKTTASKLAERIKKLQATDRWSFTFRTIS